MNNDDDMYDEFGDEFFFTQSPTQLSKSDSQKDILNEVDEFTMQS